MLVLGVKDPLFIIPNNISAFLWSVEDSVGSAVVVVVVGFVVVVVLVVPVVVDGFAEEPEELVVVGF